MSTRCQIQVEGSNVIIYKHCDGMPSRSLPWLEPFVTKFHSQCGHEPDYLTAQILVMVALPMPADLALAWFMANPGSEL